VEFVPGGRAGSHLHERSTFRAAKGRDDIGYARGVPEMVRGGNEEISLFGTSSELGSDMRVAARLGEILGPSGPFQKARGCCEPAALCELAMAR